MRINAIRSLATYGAPGKAAVVAGTRDSNAVSFVQIYLDGSFFITKTGGTMNASVPMAPGTHRLTVQAKDVAGVIFRKTIFVTAH